MDDKVTNDHCGVINDRVGQRATLISIAVIIKWARVGRTRGESAQAEESRNFAAGTNNRLAKARVPRGKASGNISNDAGVNVRRKISINPRYGGIRLDESAGISRAEKPGSGGNQRQRGPCPRISLLFRELS